MIENPEIPGIQPTIVNMSSRHVRALTVLMEMGVIVSEKWRICDRW